PVVEEMDRTGKVDPAHKKIKEAAANRGLKIHKPDDTPRPSHTPTGPELRAFLEWVRAGRPTLKKAGDVNDEVAAVLIRNDGAEHVEEIATKIEDLYRELKPIAQTLRRALKGKKRKEGAGG